HPPRILHMRLRRHLHVERRLWRFGLRPLHYLLLITLLRVESPCSWPPLLQGASADRASEAIRSIAAQLRDPPPSNNASLAFGHAGLAVLYDYLPPELCGFDSHQVSERYLDLAIDGVANQPMSASFFPGFSGVAWALEHLRARSGGSA